MRYERTRRVVLALLAVAVVVIAFLLLTGDDDDDGNGAASVSATIASGDELRSLTDDVPFTVYWAGEKSERRTEFERTDDGVFLRYLPSEGDPAEERSDSLTVGSYPVGDAVAGLRVVADRPGAETYDLPGEPNAIVVSNEKNPNSVYVGFPDSAVQVEVYDPDPREALKTVLSGDIVPLR